MSTPSRMTALRGRQTQPQTVTRPSTWPGRRRGKICGRSGWSRCECRVLGTRLPAHLTAPASLTFPAVQAVPRRDTPPAPTPSSRTGTGRPPPRLQPPPSRLSRTSSPRCRPARCLSTSWRPCRPPSPPSPCCPPGASPPSPCPAWVCPRAL